MNRLIFVYNANSGMLNGLLDSIHKIVSPDTYPCSLCSLTYGYAGMRKEWRSFIQELPVEAAFLHLDELPSHLPPAEYPCAFLQDGDRARLLISAGELNACTSIEELKTLVLSKIKGNVG
ncbi:hypothetical protein [Paenibacillus gansuensis]|uniref:GTPase n=1 Tax=Paenibacillus gansuensis TaxID=306542 RepID=A0ABW5P788_9BACL